MRIAATLRRTIALIVVAHLLVASAASADEIRVMASGGFTAAYLQLVPAFERATGHKVATTFGGSMGDGPETISNRLQEESVFFVLSCLSWPRLFRGLDSFFTYYTNVKSAPIGDASA